MIVLHVFSAAKYLRIPVHVWSQNRELKKKNYVHLQTYQKTELWKFLNRSRTLHLLEFYSHLVSFFTITFLSDKYNCCIQMYHQAFLLSRLNIGYFPLKFVVAFTFTIAELWSNGHHCKEPINTLYGFHFVQILGITSIHLASLHHIKLIICIYMTKWYNFWKYLYDIWII